MKIKFDKWKIAHIIAIVTPIPGAIFATLFLENAYKKYKETKTNKLK